MLVAVEFYGAAWTFLYVVSSNNSILFILRITFDLKIFTMTREGAGDSFSLCGGQESYNLAQTAVDISVCQAHKTAALICHCYRPTVM